MRRPGPGGHPTQSRDMGNRPPRRKGVPPDSLASLPGRPPLKSESETEEEDSDSDEEAVHAAIPNPTPPQTPTSSQPAPTPTGTPVDEDHLTRNDRMEALEAPRRPTNTGAPGHRRAPGPQPSRPTVATVTLRVGEILGLMQGSSPIHVRTTTEEEHQNGPDYRDKGPLVMRFDGGCRGNPGRGGCGAAIFNRSGRVLWVARAAMEDTKTTNNRAEFRALLLGLRCAKGRGIKELVVEGDSKLAIDAMNRTKRVHDRALKSLLAECRNLERGFDSISFSHIRRGLNETADGLANEAMDEDAIRRPERDQATATQTEPGPEEPEEEEEATPSLEEGSAPGHQQGGSQQQAPGNRTEVQAQEELAKLYNAIRDAVLEREETGEQSETEERNSRTRILRALLGSRETTAITKEYIARQTANRQKKLSAIVTQLLREHTEQQTAATCLCLAATTLASRAIAQAPTLVPPSIFDCGGPEATIFYN